MNTATAPVNTTAAAAVIGVFLLLSALFGAPAGSASAAPDTTVTSLQVDQK